MHSIADWVAGVAAADWIAGITALATVLLAIFAKLGFSSAIRLERAKWAAQLSQRFFGEEFRSIREQIDCDHSEDDPVHELVRKEPPELTELLNFFETVAYLWDSGQIDADDVRAIFRYYIKLFKSHPELLEYLSTPKLSYETLRKMLSSEW